jgi:hypothetical protein
MLMAHEFRAHIRIKLCASLPFKTTYGGNEDPHEYCTIQQLLEKLTNFLSVPYINKVVL